MTIIQQVNLYQDVLEQKQPKPFMSQAIVGVVVAILLLLGYSVYLVLALNNAKNDLAQAKQQLSANNTNIQLLQRQYPKPQINALLIKEISRSQEIQSSLFKIISLLNDKTSDQTQGFSKYFSAFSQQSISDVWLSLISINGPEHNIKLHGSTYRAAQIPVFLQKLHHEAVFKGRSFAQLSMTQASETDQQINFTVTTSTDMLEQESHE